jgi:hypothetical protein
MIFTVSVWNILHRPSYTVREFGAMFVPPKTKIQEQNSNVENAT